MYKHTIAAAVAAALLASTGAVIAAKGGNSGGHGGGAGMEHRSDMGKLNANNPGSIDRDLGRARAAERPLVRSAPLATAKVKPNRVQTAATTKITPKKAAKRTTTNTRYHSKVKHHPIPRVEHAPDFRA